MTQRGTKAKAHALVPAAAWGPRDRRGLLHNFHLSCMDWKAQRLPWQPLAQRCPQRGNCPQTVPLLLRCRFPNYCPFASEPRVSKQKQWREGPAGAGDNPNDSLALLSPSSVPLSTAGYSSGSLFMQPPPPSTFQKEEDLCQISSTAAEQGEKAQVDTRPSALTLQSAHGVSDTAREQKPTATDKGMASRSSVHLRCKGMHGPSSHTTAEPAAVPPLGTSLFPHHTAAPSPKCHGGQLKPRAPPREGKAEQSRREQSDSPGWAQNAQKADSHQRRRQTRVVLSLYFHFKGRSVAVKREKLPQSAE